MNLLATIVKADPGTAQALLLAAAAIFVLAFVIEAVDKAAPSTLIGTAGLVLVALGLVWLA